MEFALGFVIFGLTVSLYPAHPMLPWSSWSTSKEIAFHQLALSGRTHCCCWICWISFHPHHHQTYQTLATGPQLAANKKTKPWAQPMLKFFKIGTRKALAAGNWDIKAMPTCACGISIWDLLSIAITGLSHQPRRYFSPCGAVRWLFPPGTPCHAGQCIDSICGTFHGLAHFCAPVQGWPQGALHPRRFQELERPTRRSRSEALYFACEISCCCLAKSR